MKFVFPWIVLFFLILGSFYYINLNLEKTVEIKELINMSDTNEEILYSAKNVKNEDEIVSFSLLKQNEVIVIKGTEVVNNKKSNKEIILEIDRPYKDIILVLDSYEKTIWNIQASENTNIKLVIYSPNNTVVSKIKIYKYKKELFLNTEIQSQEFIQFLKYMKKITQKDKIDHFYFNNKLENIIKINKAENNPKLSLDYLSVSKANTNFEFSLISKNYEFIPFSLTGPKNLENRELEVRTNVVSSPNKDKIYEITNNGLKIINISNKKEILKPIPIIDKILQPKGIAYDDLSDMVYIANKYGKFFIFDALTMQWKSIRKYIDDFPINSISYDTFNNTFISSNWKENGLIQFDQKGNFDQKYDLKNKLLGLNYHYKKSAEIPSLYLVPNGNNIAILLIDQIVQKIWLFNKESKKTILTYNYSQEN